MRLGLGRPVLHTRSSFDSLLTLSEEIQAFPKLPHRQGRGKSARKQRKLQMEKCLFGSSNTGQSALPKMQEDDISKEHAPSALEKVRIPRKSLSLTCALLAGLLFILNASRSSMKLESHSSQIKNRTCLLWFFLPHDHIKRSIFLYLNLVTSSVIVLPTDCARRKKHFKI